MPLTDIEIRKAKAALRPYNWDEGWLFLLVKPSGSKLWQMGYRFAGKEKTLSIGAYPDISLKDAREARDNEKRVLLAGTIRRTEAAEKVGARYPHGDHVQGCGGGL